MKKLNFAVIGAGPGGQSLAAVLTSEGHRARLYDTDKDRIKELQGLAGITVTGAREAVARPDRITTDLSEAMEDADVVMIVTTADAHEAVGRAIRPYLKDGQIVLLNPGQVGGALLLSAILRSVDNPPDVVVGEALDLLYPCRLTGPGQVFHSGKKSSILIATVPARDIDRLLAVLKPVFPSFTGAESVLYTSLDCGGAILHVIPTLMNVNKMDRGETYDYYKEGITPHIAPLLEAADKERMAVCGALRATLPTLAEWMIDCYGLKEKELYPLIQENDAYIGVACPKSLSHRFIQEEVLTGFVPMSSLAKALGLETPVIDSFVRLASVLTGVDYWSKGRTAEKLGLAGKTAEEIRAFLSE